MFADLLHYYNVDLRDAFKQEPTLTPRTVLWLVEHLPLESATVAAIRGGPQFRAWTDSMYLQALIANLLYAANRQRAGKATRTPVVKPPTSKKTEPKRVLDLKQVQARIRADEVSRKLHALAAKQQSANN